MDRVHRGGPWTWGPCFVYVQASEGRKCGKDRRVRQVGVGVDKNDDSE